MVSDILKLLDNAGIQYVSWKNNHLMSESLSGNRDLDLFIPYFDKSESIKIFFSNGWVEANNRRLSTPWVTHFYKLDELGKVFHLHVYYKIVTGESLLKEYSLPLESFLLSNRERDSNGVWALNKLAQSYIFAVRHLMKGSSWESRRLYKKEIKSYEEEFEHAGRVINFSGFSTPFLIDDYIDKSGLMNDRIHLPEKMIANKFSRNMFLYKRSLMPLIIQRAVNFYNRFLNKYITKTQKKNFMQEGLIISITGIDGSGKSTMLEHLNKDMKIFLNVKKLHLGRPLPKALTLFFSALRVIFKSKKGSRENNNRVVDVQSRSTSLVKCFIPIVVALYRLKLARKATKYAQEGFLVITDRWPTKDIGKMDGPRILVNEKSSNFVKILSYFENKIYQYIPASDCCFIFNVSLETALARNAGRAEVEDEIELRNRYYNNDSPNPVAARKIYFDNDGDLKTQLHKFRNLYWQEIIRTQG